MFHTPLPHRVPGALKPSDSELRGQAQQIQEHLGAAGQGPNSKSELSDDQERVGSIDMAGMLALLFEAQKALPNDPDLAKLHLDHLGRLIRQTSVRSATELTLLPRQPAHEPPPTGGLAAWQMHKVIGHVSRNLAGNIRTEELANEVNLSTGHFFRAFKATMGETPHSFVVRQRVRRAQQMMLETGDTLSEIASACGLTDQAHLTRLFKRMVGTTPLVWRRRWQDDGAADLACGART